MFWRSPQKSIIISAELHDKIARSCVNMNDIPGEVIKVRTVGRNDRRKEVREARQNQVFSYGA